MVSQLSWTHNYGYRYYSSTTGRWLNRDPIGENGGVSIYCCTSNGPVNATDLLGLKCCGAFMIFQVADVKIPTTQQKGSGMKDTLDGFKVVFIPTGCTCTCPPQQIVLVQSFKWVGKSWTYPAFDTHTKSPGKKGTTGPVEYPPYGGYSGPEGDGTLMDTPNYEGANTFESEVCAICRYANGAGDRILGCFRFTFSQDSRQLSLDGGKILPSNVTKEYGKGNKGDGNPTIGYGVPCSEPGTLWKSAETEWFK